MLLLDSTLSPVDFKSLVSEGLSLCINITDIQNDAYHLRYCNTLIGDKVDRVIAISGRFNIHHPCISVDYPNIITLSDPNHLWLSSLNFDISTEKLSKDLRCQQLWDTGQEKNFWFQPMDDHWESFINQKNISKTIIKHVGKPGIEYLRSLSKETRESLFERDSEKLMNCDTINHDFTFAGVIDLLLWYRLVPNQNL